MVWLFNPQNDSIEKLLQRLKYYAISIASSKDATIHFATGKETEIIKLFNKPAQGHIPRKRSFINNAVNIQNA